MTKKLEGSDEISILFSIVEKSNNYVSEEDLITHSPRERTCKFWILPIVYGGIFYGGGGVGFWGYVGGSFYGGIFHERREFSMKGAPDIPES